MISVSEAIEKILTTTPSTGMEKVPLAEACGKTLAEPIKAERPGPPFDRVAMDGVALNSHAGTREYYEIGGVQAAGAPQLKLENPVGCLEAMTGAPLPEGCDCVIPYELVEIKEGRAYLQTTDLSPFRNIHRKGSDYSQGEVLLGEGTPIGPPEIAIIASQGVSLVPVFRLPRVAVACTGDELVDVEGPVEPHQIRKSNIHAIDAALKAFGVQSLETFHIKDNMDESKSVLKDLIDRYDVVILSGGVSKGKFDYVPDALAQAGVEKLFHRIKQKPGKPMFYGLRGKTQVFGLPGNPVSSLICLRRYVVASLLKRLGLEAREMHVSLKSEVSKKKPVTLFAPGKLWSDTKEGIRFAPSEHNGSGDFSGLKGTDGFIEVPEESQKIDSGATAAFFPWTFYLR